MTLWGFIEGWQSNEKYKAEALEGKIWMECLENIKEVKKWKAEK